MTVLTRQRSAFLPDFCSVRMAVAVILIAELLAIVLTLTHPGNSTERFEQLALNSLFVQWVALMCTAVLCLLRQPLNRLPDIWSALLSYCTMLVITLLVAATAWWLLQSRPMLDTGSDWSSFVLRCLGISGIVSALALRYFYVQHQWRAHVRLEANARLQALQARIRPHFLFNSMNTIASLTRREPALAEQVVEDLADLFRLTLAETDDLVTLAEEFELCQRYLRIEQLRLGNRLQVHWDIEALPDDARIPPLTLQPLLENAVYHGIEPRTDGGLVNIHGEVRGKHLLIYIENPLPAPAAAREHGNQLAQDNVRQRLIGAFENAAKLSVDVTTGRYRVELLLPYRRH
ncbi:MAG: histidine kinase [Gammaproteobacteria bacterium]